MQAFSCLSFFQARIGCTCCDVCVRTALACSKHQHKEIRRQQEKERRSLSNRGNIIFPLIRKVGQPWQKRKASCSVPVIRLSNCNLRERGLAHNAQCCQSGLEVGKMLDVCCGVCKGRLHRRHYGLSRDASWQPCCRVGGALRTPSVAMDQRRESEAAGERGEEGVQEGGPGRRGRRSAPRTCGRRRPGGPARCPPGRPPLRWRLHTPTLCCTGILRRGGAQSWKHAVRAAKPGPMPLKLKLIRWNTNVHNCDCVITLGAAMRR